MPNAIAFVASGTIPPSPPPVTETGVVKWVRENLVSSWLNAILTVLSVLFIVLLVIDLLPWFTNSVWNAKSLEECRQLGGPGGACFAVIHERWAQFAFGFYPADQYWRPVLCFVLLLAAVAPVLYSGLPKGSLWFTAIFPALGYFLLFGGSIWGPVLVLATVPLVMLLYRAVARLAGAMPALILTALVAVLWLAFAVAPLDGVLESLIPIGLMKVESRLIGGFTLTLIIGVVAIAASLPVGVLLALGRQSKLLIVRSIAVIFIEFVRGVPLITLLFVASTLLNIFLPPGTEFDLLLRVLILVILFASAYMAETIRGGLAALGKGQYEAADALGLDYWASMRLVVLPQALKISIPGIVNNFIGLFKDTTLVSQISMFDPLGIIRPISSDSAWHGVIWELYGFVGLFFFIFCYAMSRYSQSLERKLKTDHR